MGQRALLRGRGHVPPGFSVKDATVFVDVVPPDRIKIMGLKGGKTINDETDLNRYGLDDLVKKGEKLLVMGSCARGGESTGRGDSVRGGSAGKRTVRGRARGTVSTGVVESREHVLHELRARAVFEPRRGVS